MSTTLGDVAKSMRKLSGRGRASIDKALTRELKTRAKIAKRLARKRGPKRTGGLMRSIRVEVKRHNFALWAEAPQARVVELGGRSRNVVFRPTYYLRDAQTESMRTFDRAVLAHIDRELMRA